MLPSSAPPLATMEMDSGPVDPVSELKLTSMDLPARDDSSLSLTATRFLLVLIEQTHALFIDYRINGAATKTRNDVLKRGNLVLIGKR